jgi:UTP--glucose-1-phosphate uridylyltransferase
MRSRIISIAHSRSRATSTSKAKYDLLETLSGTRLQPGQAAFVRQQEMAGLGHAVWCARYLIGDEPFAVLLPTNCCGIRRAPASSRCATTYEAKGGNVVSVIEVPEQHTHRYGIVDPGAVDGAVTEVKGLVEKPRAGTAPSRLAVVGRYILQPDVLDISSMRARPARAARSS